MKGYIHSFDTFGTVDGPGIRFILFMQGCPLQCQYCHNRDTWNMKYGKEYTPDEVIKEVLKYKNYYNSSGGGLTVTGGEPFMQPDFLLELLKLAKENDIHTCIDTSGYVDIAEADPILDYTDLVLLDLKQMNDIKYTELTGRNLSKTLIFAERLESRKIPVWIRHVLIPGKTDDEADLMKLSNFVNSLTNVEDFELLKYHTMGVFKWEKLGYAYPLEGVREANDEDIMKALGILNINL